MVFRKILGKILITILAAAGILAACVFYAFRIEPYRITVREYAMGRGAKAETELKIAQISDLHIKEDYTVQNLDKVLRKLDDLEPDLVIFTGDLYDNYAGMHDNQSLIESLSGIKAKYGKVAVWGNRDYGGGAVRKYEELMTSAGFTLLRNEHLRIFVEGKKSLLLTGLDDALLGNPRMPAPPSGEPADYEILLLHEPDVSDDYAALGYDLTMSGHSHGGQVRLPFVRAVTTALGEKYIGGMYEVGGQKPQSLYVNTGIGTTHISARFGVVPEIALFHISI